MRITRWPTGGELGQDLLLAAVLAVVAVFGSQRAQQWQAPAHTRLDGVGLVLLLVPCAVLALRRAAPLPVLAVAALADAAYLLARYPYGPAFFALSAALVTVAAECPVRVSAIACGAAFALQLGCMAVALPAHPRTDLLLDAAGTAWLALPWAAAVALRLRRDGTAKLRAAQRHAESSQERLEFAREIHDVVGHGLSVISLQAGVALHVMEVRPEQTRAALEAIRQASRESLAELRGTLRLYRSVDAERPGGEKPGEERRPVAGLARLPELLAGAETAGLRVEAVTEPLPRLPTAVDLVAYRIVQEALTNTLRHADATSVRVRVGVDPDGRLGVEVRDDGRRQPAADHELNGFGLLGMRERCAALDGTLDTGPAPEGGFRIRARLPLRELH